ncbi:hypothetical protein HYH02_006699 [Chlamydomonas schloesseri]|uniref:Uncharacterized protein n=1 Tax=Chlamydomonas schloesseri TaxID=2026947 RepID=A0A835WJ15_9CHLO|nr:hypothetical protein HYH02_006699 [Chlamydomonas schloesseri]|eukprot:KAG2448114.1 hypothetical protein HYH02_006699 [Chlamydomonas schloesseri]
MGLVGADMLFFLVCLLVQAFTSGLHMGRKWSSVGVNGVNLYWWPTPKTLTLEEVAFSLVVDLVGVMAGFQEKPPVLGLFLLLDLITTILIGIHGISLFLLFRGVQMAVCILYRNALVHCMGMCMTEVERLEFLSTELGIMTILHTMAGFCGVLCGIEPQQAQRASRDGQEAAASPSLREGSAAPPPEQIMATPSTMSRTASIAGTAAEPGTEPEGGTAETDGAQPQPSSSPTLMLLAPTAGQALERQHQPSVLGADVPIPARGALAPAGTVSGAEPLTTVAVFSFAAGAAHASVQRSDTASSRQPDVSANATAAGPADWCLTSGRSNCGGGRRLEWQQWGG